MKKAIILASAIIVLFALSSCKKSHWRIYEGGAYCTQSDVVDNGAFLECIPSNNYIEINLSDIEEISRQLPDMLTISVFFGGGESFKFSMSNLNDLLTEASYSDMREEMRKYQNDLDNLRDTPNNRRFAEKTSHDGVFFTNKDGIVFCIIAVRGLGERFYNSLKNNDNFKIVSPEINKEWQFNKYDK